MVSSSKFSPTSILEVAASLRKDGSVPTLLFDHPLSGKQCFVYAIQFHNGTRWAIRIPAHLTLPKEAIANHVETEAFLLRRLADAGFSWSPRLIGYDAGFDNPIAFPYLALTWIDGTPLRWTDSLPAERATRDRFLRQLADVLLELAFCTKEAGDTTTTTAGAHLTGLIDRRILRVLRGQLPGLDVKNCLLERALIPRVVHKTPGDPLVISHEDLAAVNIIVDVEYNIQGIIDWGFASYRPLQVAVRFPRFLAIEPHNISDPPPDDIVAFSRSYLRPSPSLQADRHCVISHLRNESHNEEADRTSLRRLITSILSDPDVDWRFLMIESSVSKGLCAWMAKRFWLIHGTQQGIKGLLPIEKILHDQADGFLTRMEGKLLDSDHERLVAAVIR